MLTPGCSDPRQQRFLHAEDNVRKVKAEPMSYLTERIRSTAGRDDNGARYRSHLGKEAVRGCSEGGLLFRHLGGGVVVLLPRQRRLFVGNEHGQGPSRNGEADSAPGVQTGIGRAGGHTGERLRGGRAYASQARRTSQSR